MWYVHVDPTDLIILPPDDPNFLGRLQEHERVWSAIAHEKGNARGHAARLRRKRAFLSGEYLVEILLHVLLHPRLQVRIGKIGNPKCRLFANTVRGERMRRIADDGRQEARDGLVERTTAVQSDPAGQIR